MRRTKIVAAMLSLVFVFMLFPNLRVNAATVSGTFENGGNWYCDEPYLYIFGVGEMPDFSNKAPWFDYRNNIYQIKVYDGFTSTGRAAFYDCCDLESVDLPDTLTSIGDYSFFNCHNLPSISIPDGVTSIGDYAFSWCYYLTNFEFPSGLTTIGESAFINCNGLTNIAIPDSVTSIGIDAFSYCDNLKSVTMSWDLFSTLGNDPINDYFYESPVTIYFCKETLTADNGTISVESRDYTNGTITLKLDPDTNYALGSVSVKYSDGTVEDVIPNNGKYIVDVTKGDIEVNATFIPTYEIKFINTDGTVLQSSSVPSGDTPTYTGTTPTKTEDEQYTYTFSGWTPTIVPVTGDATYTAVFDKIAKSTPTAEPTAATTPATTPAVTTTPAPGTYFVKSIEEKDGAIVITIKRTENDDQTYELVQSIETDGTQLKVGDQIDLTSGSAIITIKKDYVSTLTPGTHTMKVTFKDGGSITLEYTVKEPEKAAAQAVQATGEATAITAIVGGGMILAACGVALFAMRKRREES